MTAKLIPWKDLQQGELVGQGSYGKVYRGSWNGQEVAIKRLHLLTLSPKELEIFRKEAEIMADCLSERIVKLFGVCLERGFFALVMEFVKNGSLYEALHQAPTALSWHTRRQITLEIGQGLSFLHEKGILHGNLNSHNVLIDEKNRVKITDFGISKIKLATSITGRHKKSTDAVRWHAYELFDIEGTPTQASDVYSYGMVIGEIVACRIPFSEAKNEQEVINWICQGVQEKIPEDCAPLFRNLIEQCRSKEPAVRPAIRTIIAQIQAEIQASNKRVLEGYQQLYPQFNKIVSRIVERTADALRKKNYLTPPDSALEPFQDFLAIALYGNSQLREVLIAQQQRLGKSSSIDQGLNLINLVAQLSSNFEDEWQQWVPSLRGFKEGQFHQYRELISFMETTVQRSLMLPTATCWYATMNKRFEKFIKSSPMTESEIRQKLASHPLPSTPNIASPSTLPSVKQVAFPVDSLKQLLKLADEAHVQEMLNNAKEGKRTELFSFIDNYFYKFSESSPVTDILAANLTFSSIKSVLGLTFSKIDPSTLWKLYKDYTNGKDITTGQDQGETGGLIEAISELKSFLKAFYVSTRSTLDYQALAIALLKDEQLYNFVSDRKVIKQLAGFSAAAQVPGLDLSTAEESIKLFVSLQKSVLQLKNRDQIHTFHDLGLQLAQGNLSEIISLLDKSLKLVLQLEGVIKVYLKPLVFPIQMLALSPVAALLKNRSVLKKFKNRAFSQKELTFVDCKTVFENYQNDDRNIVGKLPTPVFSHIRYKNLSLYSFSGKGIISEKTSQLEEPFSDSSKTFQGLAFEDFSFEQAHFTDFGFENSYFENCNFSNATFEGEIRFSNTYIDAETASTFLPALSQALYLGRCSVKGPKGIILIALADVKKNKVQSIPKELEPYIEEQCVTWISGRSDPYLPAFDSPPKIEETSAPQPPGYFNSLLGGLGAIASYSASYMPVGYIAQGYETLKSYYTGSSDQVADELATDHTKEKAAFAAWKKLLDAQIEDLQSQIKSVSSTQQNTTEILDNTQQELKAAVEEQKNQLETMETYLAFIKSQQEVKASIRAEQEVLLHHKTPQVTLFYKTFLTELSSVLQAILILQNSVKLIAPALGEVTSVSNKQEKGALIKAAQENPSRTNKIVEFLLNLKDHVIEFATILKPAVHFIPKVGDAVAAGIDIMQEWNDKNILNKTRNAYRGLTPKTLEKIADAIARKIALAYAEQIGLLNEKGAIRFAECGVLRVAATLFNGNITDTENFAAHACLAIRMLEANQNQKTLLELPNIELFKIPFTHQALGVALPATGELLEDQLYRQPGIFFEESGAFHYYSNDKKLPGGKCPLDTIPTCADKIGYMHVTKGEWQTYYKDFVTKDDHRRGPPGVLEPVLPVSSSSIQPSTNNRTEIPPQNNGGWDVETLVALQGQSIKLLQHEVDTIRKDLQTSLKK